MLRSVEGAEPDVLLGALNIITRDRPILTLEVEFAYKERTKNLLQQVLHLDYKLHLVPEVCGVRRTLRNVICIPVEYRVSARTSAALANGTIQVDRLFLESLPDACSHAASCFPSWYQSVFGSSLSWHHSVVSERRHCEFVSTRYNCTM